MFDAVAVGSATEDVFVVVRDTKIVRIEDADSTTAYLALPHGAKISVDQVKVLTGGGATNVSAGLAAMGLRAAALCKVGQDGPGERVVEDLRSRGVDTSLIVVSQEHATAYSVILMCFTGERTILVHRGASEQLTWEDVPEEKLAQTAWLYLGSMGGPAMALFFELAEFAASKGIRLALNPGSAQLKLGLDGLKPALKHAELVVLNEAEARLVTGVAPQRTRADEHEMLRMLVGAGCKMAVITAGEDGADGYDGSAFYYVPAYRTQAVSTVGAGDSFIAGCIAALHRGLPLPEAMKIGAANAASVVRQVGAKEGLLSWDEAEAFVKSH
ncbi:MAG: carbohydrate kinase family protein [Armatimonadetes bacterium]|nr:carbohydrate kinase family protein [Armatimonadota bacterium]